MERRTFPNLRRSRYTREPKKRFILFCEGINTEPAYFKALERSLDGIILDVRPKGVPITTAEAAVAERKRKKVDRYDKTDQIWAVFDRDEHPRYEEARQLCWDNDVGLAYSDPCFELWIILHEQDYDKGDGHNVVQTYLEKIRPDYDSRKSKIPDCDEIIRRVINAEKRAQKQLELRQKDSQPYSRPSTTVGMLTLAIRKTAQKGVN